MRSVIFSLIKTEEIIRSLSCKNPFCAIVKGLRLFKASEEQIPTAICEETTKRVNCHENGNLPLFYIEKDTRIGVLYAPFACVLMVYPTGLVRPQSGGKRSKAERYVISDANQEQYKPRPNAAISVLFGKSNFARTGEYEQSRLYQKSSKIAVFGL